MVTGPPASAVTMRPAGLSKTVAASVFSVRPDISGISSATDRKASAAQASPMKIFTFQWLARKPASDRHAPTKRQTPSHAASAGTGRNPHNRTNGVEGKRVSVRVKFGGRRYLKKKRK